MAGFAAVRAIVLTGIMLCCTTPASAGRGTQIDEPYGFPSCRLGATYCDSVDISSSGLFRRAYIYQEGIVSLDALLPVTANATDPTSLGTGWWFAPGLSEGAGYFVNAYRQPATFEKPAAYGLNFFSPDRLPVGPYANTPPAMQVLIGSGTGARLAGVASGGWDGISIVFGYDDSGLPAAGALIGMSWNNGDMQTVRNVDGLLVGPAASDTDFVSTASIRMSGGPGLSAPTRFIPRYASIDAAVPEPATWAMLILGFGIMGASLRRRRRSHAAIA